MQDTYNYFFQGGYVASYWVGVVFFAIIVLGAYLGGMVGGAIALFKNGWPKTGAVYIIAYLAMIFYSVPEGYYVITADWANYKFMMSFIGAPITFVLIVGVIIFLARMFGPRKVGG